MAFSIESHYSLPLDSQGVELSEEEIKVRLVKNENNLIKLAPLIDQAEASLNVNCDPQNEELGRNLTNLRNQYQQSERWIKKYKVHLKSIIFEKMNLENLLQIVKNREMEQEGVQTRLEQIRMSLEIEENADSISQLQNEQQNLERKLKLDREEFNHINHFINVKENENLPSTEMENNVVDSETNELPSINISSPFSFGDIPEINQTLINTVPPVPTNTINSNRYVNKNVRETEFTPQFSNSRRGIRSFNRRGFPSSRGYHAKSNNHTYVNQNLADHVKNLEINNDIFNQEIDTQFQSQPTAGQRTPNVPTTHYNNSAFINYNESIQSAYRLNQLPQIPSYPLPINSNQSNLAAYPPPGFNPQIPGMAYNVPYNHFQYPMLPQPITYSYNQIPNASFNNVIPQNLGIPNTNATPNLAVNMNSNSSPNNTANPVMLVRTQLRPRFMPYKGRSRSQLDKYLKLLLEHVISYSGPVSSSTNFSIISEIISHAGTEIKSIAETMDTMDMTVDDFITTLKDIYSISVRKNVIDDKDQFLYAKREKNETIITFASRLRLLAKKAFPEMSDEILDADSRVFKRFKACMPEKISKYMQDTILNYEAGGNDYRKNWGTLVRLIQNINNRFGIDTVTKILDGENIDKESNKKGEEKTQFKKHFFHNKNQNYKTVIAKVDNLGNLSYVQDLDNSEEIDPSDLNSNHSESQSNDEESDLEAMTQLQNNKLKFPNKKEKKPSLPSSEMNELILAAKKNLEERDKITGTTRGKPVCFCCASFYHQTNDCKFLTGTCFGCNQIGHTKGNCAAEARVSVKLYSDICSNNNQSNSEKKLPTSNPISNNNNIFDQYQIKNVLAELAQMLTKINTVFENVIPSPNSNFSKNEIKIESNQNNATLTFPNENKSSNEPLSASCNCPQQKEKLKVNLESSKSSFPAVTLNKEPKVVYHKQRKDRNIQLPLCNPFATLKDQLDDSSEAEDGTTIKSLKVDGTISSESDKKINPNSPKENFSSNIPL